MTNTAFIPIIKSVGSKINEVCRVEDGVQPLNSEILLSTLLKIATTNVQLFHSSLDLFVSYLTHFKDERNKEYNEVTRIFQKCNNQSLPPLNRFELAKPLLLIIHCLSDTMISQIVHFLVEIFNQLFDESDLSKIPFNDIYEIKKHCIDDFLYSDKLLNSVFDYLFNEFESTNSPGSALAFSFVIQQLQEKAEAAEFTDTLIKFCFKSDLKFHCIGSFLLLSFTKATTSLLESFPNFVFDNLKNFIVSENPTLASLSTKAMKFAILENLFNSFHHFKSILHQYTYYNDFYQYKVIMDSFIRSFEVNVEGDETPLCKNESLQYLARFLHTQISNEKATSKEKDTFLYLAGILMLLYGEAYGDYYEDDINVAVSLLETGQFGSGPAAFFAGSTTIPNRSVRQLISSHIPGIIRFASNPQNDIKSRCVAAESFAVIVSNKDYKSFLSDYVSFRESLMTPSENEVTLKITKRMEQPFLTAVHSMEQTEAIKVSNLAIKILLSTASPVQFKISIKLLHRLLKYQKICCVDVNPIVTGIIDGTLPVFAEIPVYLYSGSSSEEDEKETVSVYIAKFLTSYLKSVSLLNQSQASNDLSAHLISRLLEWLPLALDSTLVAVVRPLVQAIKMKKINSEVIDRIIDQLLSIPKSIGIKEHILLISSTTEAISFLLESYPDKFQVSKIFTFLNNINFDEFDEDSSEDEEEEEEEGNDDDGSTAEQTPGRAGESNRRSSQENDDDDDDDIVEVDDDDYQLACELIEPFKVKIAFLTLTVKHVNSLDEDTLESLEAGFEYMFCSRKLDVAPSLFKLCLKVLKTNQTLAFKKLLCMEMIDFIFKPKWILVKYGVDEGIEKEVFESLVSIFKDQKRLYDALRKYCALKRHNFMMFNTYFRKLD